MATVDRNTVKSWFVKYAKPTADQFARFFDSIIFKGEKIPTSSVEDFDSIMLAKADRETFENHVKDSSRHLSPEERIKWNNKVDKENGKMLSSNDFTDQDKQKLKGLPFSADLQNLLNRDILSITITGDKNKILTLTKIDGTILSAPFNDLGNSADVFLNGLNFNAANGTFTAVLNDSKTSSVNIDGRYSLLNHHHDDRYLKLDGGIVKGETTFNSPIFMNDTLELRNELHIKQSISAMDTAPDTIGINKGWVNKKINQQNKLFNTKDEIREILISYGKGFRHPSNTDLNSIIKTGFHRLSAGNTNMPEGNISDWGQMIVSRCDNQSDTISQILLPYSSSEMFFRSGNPSNVGGNGNWRPWSKVYHSNNFGKNEIEAMKIDANTISGKSIDYFANKDNIPTKTSQLSNDSGFAYLSNVPNIQIVAIGGVITSNTLNVLYKEDSYPIKTILVNKEAGNEAAYIRISSTKWLKLNSNLI